MSTTPARKRAKPQPFVVKVRTANVIMEYKGTIEQGIEMCFFYIADPEKRLAVMERLKQAHAKLLEAAAKEPVISSGDLRD